MVTIGKKTWWNEIKFCQDLGAPPQRKPRDLKKGLQSLCFGRYIKHMSLDIKKIMRHVFDNICQNINFPNLSSNHVAFYKVGRDLH